MLKEPGYNARNKQFALVWSCLLQQGLDKKCTQYEVVGKQEHGHPRKTWQQYINYNLKSLKLSKDITSNHNAWVVVQRMTKSPTHKNCGTWAQSGQVRSISLELLSHIRRYFLVLSSIKLPFYKSFHVAQSLIHWSVLQQLAHVRHFLINTR